MPLQRILISDFQSHKRTELSLSYGVNAIVGNSDSGKSAIFRAVSWAVFNRCDDKGFRRRNGKTTAVDLIFDDKIEVSREKDNNNTYILFDGKKEKSYTAFKTDIPEDIVSALNLSDINVQAQLDSPFLLSNSSGEVAKTLNKIANLEIIDKAISNARKKTQANARDIVTTQNQIEDLEKQLESFKFLPQLEKDVKVYEGLLKEEKDGENQIQKLVDLISDIRKSQQEINELKSFLDLEIEVQRIVQKLKNWEDIKQNISDLSSIVVSALHDQVRIETAEKMLKLEKEVNNVLELIEDQKNNQKEIRNLKDLITTIQSKEEWIKKFEKDVKNLKREYDNLFPEECPLCGK